MRLAGHSLGSGMGRSKASAAGTALILLLVAVARPLPLVAAQGWSRDVSFFPRPYPVDVGVWSIGRQFTPCDCHVRSGSRSTPSFATGDGDA